MDSSVSLSNSSNKLSFSSNSHYLWTVLPSWPSNWMIAEAPPIICDFCALPIHVTPSGMKDNTYRSKLQWRRASVRAIPQHTHRMSLTCSLGTVTTICVWCMSEHNHCVKDVPDYGCVCLCVFMHFSITPSHHHTLRHIISMCTNQSHLITSHS